MFKIWQFLLLFLLVGVSLYSQNGEKNFIDQPYIEVIGKIESEITPNEIYLNISLNENDKKGKISIEDQENQMISLLKSLQIDLEKNLSILDFSGYFKRKFLSDNEVTKTKVYQLIVNDGETLGKVFKALDRIDISNISIIKTSHSDIEKIRKETKLNALKVAKEKANSYANVLDQNIGKALYIKEIQNNSNNNIYKNNFRELNEVVILGYGSHSKEDKIQNLNIKTITVSATVMAKFSLI